MRIHTFHNELRKCVHDIRKMQDNDLPMKNWVKNVLVVLPILSAFPADWSCIAVFAILGMHKNRGNLKKQMLVMLLCVAVYSAVSFFFVSRSYALVQFGVLLVYPVLRLYNGKKGSAKWRSGFSIFTIRCILPLSGFSASACMGISACCFNGR